MQSTQRVRFDIIIEGSAERDQDIGGCLLMNAIVPDWFLVGCHVEVTNYLLYMINTSNHLALSPGQPSLSGGQEDAKNLPVVYPSDTLMTTQLIQKIIPTINNQ